MGVNTTASVRWLTRVEALGNRLPHPTLLFIYLCLFVLLLSLITAGLEMSAVHPMTGETITAVNLFSGEGLRLILTKAVTNFTQFAPVGSVLVAMLGLGIAEQSGLLSAVLRATVLKAPENLLSYAVVFVGVLSSLAVDTGYVVLIPLAALMFVSVGRSPLVGIAAAFAGVSGGFSANLLIGPIDALLAGITTEAAALAAPTYEVNAAGNYYFIVVSSLLISVLGGWVTERWVAPQFECDGEQALSELDQGLSDQERRGLRAAGLFSVLFIGLLLLTIVPEQGVLRGENGAILKSPFIQGIVVLISVYAALAGAVYGRYSGSFAKADDVIVGMESSMSTMAGYLVLMFFAAQFVSYFAWSQLGIIAAIKGAELLQLLNLNSAFLLVSFVLLTALLNLLIGSASAKWALIAPIFVPMLLLVGISPEAAQVAFRIGDSSTNIITPLMPYFGVVVAFAQKYKKDAGIGTIVAMMLPYSVAFLLCWSLLLVLWVLLGWPLGPGAGVLVN